MTEEGVEELFINVAYLKDMLESYLTPVDCSDESVPLKVLCCGLYRVMNRDSVIATDRPNGRKDYQLLYFHSGQGHFSFCANDAPKEKFNPDARTVVSAGQIVLFRPGDRQVYEYYASDRTEVYWVHFTGSEVEKILENCGLHDVGQVFWGGTLMQYPEIFMRMIQELQLCQNEYEKLLAVYLQELFLTISRNRNRTHITGSSVDKNILDALRHFNAHYAEPIKVDEYAASLYMSTCWFIRSFRQYAGVTPLQYLISVRIANARELLLNQTYSIMDVASMVGYDDPLYFSRIFKRAVGMSPREYRKAVITKSCNLSSFQK